MVQAKSGPGAEKFRKIGAVIAHPSGMVQKVSIHATMQNISVKLTYNIRSGTDVHSGSFRVMHTSLWSKKRSYASTVCLSRRAPAVLSLHSTSNRGGQLLMSGCEDCSQNYSHTSMLIMVITTATRTLATTRSSCRNTTPMLFQSVHLRLMAKSWTMCVAQRGVQSPPPMS